MIKKHQKINKKNEIGDYKRVYLRNGRAPIPTNKLTSYIMSKIRAKNTVPEKKLRNAMFLNNIIGYRLHYKGVPGKPDMVFTKKKIAIFVNGCYWHRCPICRPKLPKTHKVF